jgi:2-iminoacetate synthase
MKIKDPDQWREMFDIAAQIKRKVYDHRIVMFAPLYCSNKCINNCLYCGFRRDNHQLVRKQLNQDEIAEEAKHLAGVIGHKRLIMVFGEHPQSDLDYILQSMETVYNVRVPARVGTGSIRRVNINAAPMSTEDLHQLHKAGIGTYQVFQETYHQQTYQQMHPQNTLKSNFNWRLFAMHRAMEAGMIITAREEPSVIRSLYPVVTQRDASTCIEIGGYREWLDDFASDATRTIGRKVIQKEMEEIKQSMP